MTPSSPPLRSWAEIDLAALQHNYRHAASLHPGASLMGVIKANGYGHGLRRMARELSAAGAEFLGVANCGEARRISEAGVTTKIYILGPTFPDERLEIVENNWRACISSIEEAGHFNALAEAAGTILPVHLTLDTGMGRGGFLPNDAAAAVEKIGTLPNLFLEGAGSHLPSADEDETFTHEQIAQFNLIISSLPALKYVHLSNSAGLIGYQQEPCNLVRPGLMLYGASPMPRHQNDLIPVMSLMSRVSIIRTLPAGHGISYGRETILSRDTRVATIGIGYGDGYPRSLSGNGAEVFIRGKRFPLLGRVTMDQIMVDVTRDPDIFTGDTVELFGKNILVTEVARKAGTIPWEIFTGITPRVTRVETS